MMFKYYINELPGPVTTFFGGKNSEKHNHNARYRDILHVLIGYSDATYVNFNFYAIYIWNIIYDCVNNNVSCYNFTYITKSYMYAHEIEYRLRT